MAVTSSGTRILRYSELASTNTEAMRLAQAGEPGPVWVVAERQTAGKGRSGRSWIGDFGNLFASYLFHAKAPVGSVHQLSLVAGVATFDAISALGIGKEHGLRLKWPNDILTERAKIGGILIESSVLPRRQGVTAVIGVGLNVVSHPEIEGREVTSLKSAGSVADPAAVLDALDAALRQALLIWDNSAGFAAIRARWLERSGPLGERVSVQGGEGQISGAFAGLDDDGALLVDLEGGERRRCTYGDVTLT